MRRKPVLNEGAKVPDARGCGVGVELADLGLLVVARESKLNKQTHVFEGE